ncbi:MAG TPA: GTPase Era [Candidatus Eisenbacteria bacterium]|nr:GTPase Era [Candidatus Eisenbacteria bacterium]
MSHRAGTAVIVGRPNVGKSTLLNALVGQKVAIVTPRPQTTRTRVVGIRTLPDAQVVFLDTPGIHPARSLLNRRMVELARSALADADVAVLVVDAGAGITHGDRALAEELAGHGGPVVVVLNKLDRIVKSKLLPSMAELGRLLPEAELVPGSAKTGAELETVLGVIVKHLPEGPNLYPDDEFTTETERHLVAELVREQVFLATREEIPYGVAVVVDEFTEKPERRVTVVKATVLVDRENHKPIVIGAGGERLKAIGTKAREEIEALLGTKVFLELFVRVEPGWSESPRRLAELGL